MKKNEKISNENVLQFKLKFANRLDNYDIKATLFSKNSVINFKLQYFYDEHELMKVFI